MNLAYVSTDEVHQDLAYQLARAYRVDVHLLTPTDRVPERLDAVIYDLDYLPPEDREHVLDRLIGSPANGLVAVHGYNLFGDQAKALKRNGVLVRRRLGRNLFRALLRRAVEHQPGAARAGRGALRTV
jgi:hypothetical protein